ncbi:MAG: type II toxin-antitoxin system VapC family toxin [Planctomycetota bacterium]
MIVSTLNLHEVFKEMLRQRGEDSAFQAIAVMQQGQIVDVTSIILLNAAKHGRDHELPMADSIIHATAQLHQATLWTQDDDFERMPGVNFVRK